MPADFEISPLITEPPRQTQPPPAAPMPGVPITPMTPPKPVKKHRALKWAILLGAVLFVVAVASLLFGGNSFSDSNVVVTLTAPEQAMSGDQVTYHIGWHNNTRTALHNLRFRLFYPTNSIVVGANGQPGASDSMGFTLDDVAAGASQSRDFQVFLVGDKGEIKTARLNLIFIAGNLQSPFEKNVNAATAISDLPVSLTLVAPPTAIPGQSIEYLLDVRNTTGADLTDLKLQFTYPDGFTPKKFTPQPDTSTTTWSIASLKSGSGTRITVDGILNGNPMETKNVAVALQHQLDGQYVDYVKTNSFTMLSSPLVSVSIQPDAGRDYVAFAGDRLKYVATYRNSSPYTLLGVTLAVKLEGAMFDFAGLQSGVGAFNDSTSTLTFDSSGVPDFGALPPGKSGQVTFTAPLKTSASGQAGATTLFVKATATLGTTQIPTGANGGAISATDSLVTKIGSLPSLTWSALFDSGAGSGPLPMQVGQATTLTVRWQLVNPGNDVKNAKVTATLAPGVTWAGGAAITNGGAPPTFDATHNTVTWSIGTLPFGTGNGTARYEATFKVSVTPSSNQSGQSLPLATGTALAGVDSFTGQTVSATTHDLTTVNIENHPDDSRVQ